MSNEQLTNGNLPPDFNQAVFATGDDPVKTSTFDAHVKENSADHSIFKDHGFNKDIHVSPEDRNAWDGKASKLNDLEDVFVEAPIDTQVLVYDASRSKWVNKRISGGTGGGTVNWSDIVNKPNTFTPSAHFHALTDVTGLNTALSEKVNKSGDTMSGNLAIGSHTWKAFVQSSDSVDKAVFGVKNSSGSLIGSLNVDANSPTYVNGSGTNTIYHSGNSNKNSVDWTANGLKANSIKSGKTYYSVANRTTLNQTEIGAIKITLPFSWSNNMGTYEIDLYEYSARAHTKFIISGYNYTAENWISCSCTVLGKPTSDMVRLAHDGEKCCILLGDITTSWSYPQVYISKVTQGFTNTADWSNGWDISFITDLTNISRITSVVPNANMPFNNYVHPTFTSRNAGGNRHFITSFTSNTEGHVTGITTQPMAKSDIETLLTGIVTTHDHTYLISTDLRNVKPNTSGIHDKQAIRPFFVSTSELGINKDKYGLYSDLLILDTYINSSGGGVNAIAFAKRRNVGDLPEAFIGNGAWNSGSWDSFKRLWHEGNSNLPTEDWTAKNLQLNGDRGIGDVQLELWRGTNASWKVLNNGGNLKFQCNYTSVVGNYFDVLNLNYNTGNAQLKGVLNAGGLQVNSNPVSLEGHTHDYLDATEVRKLRDGYIYYTTLPLQKQRKVISTLSPLVPIDEVDNNAPTANIYCATSYMGFYDNPNYIEVNQGETLEGSIMAMRKTGATGSPGVLYFGIERFDKNKKPIADNSGCTYIVNTVTVPSDGIWRKYSGVTTLPTSHTPYNGSDGGPVRYIKIRILVNHSTGTIPTYWSSAEVIKRDEVVNTFSNQEIDGIKTFVKDVTAPNFIGNLTGDATKSSVLKGNVRSSVVAKPGTGELFFDYNISSTTEGLFPRTDNSSAIININRHTGNYDSQLGFSSNGNLYYRSFTNEALNTTRPWKQLAFTESNVASATKLQTVRTIWGRGFDGTENVTGSLNLGAGYAITGKDNLDIIKDHNNGNVTLSATGGDLYVGYTNTGQLRFNSFGVWNSTGLGIGISVPTEKLDVIGNIKGSSNLILTSTSGGKKIILGNQDSNGTNKPSIIHAANGSLFFGYGDSWVGSTGGNMTNVMSILNNDRVGIGISSPLEKLHVVGNAKIAGNIETAGYDFVIKKPGTTGGWARGLMLHNASSSVEGGVSFFGNGDDFQRISLGFGSNHWNGNGITINAQNNIGIGISLPTAKLHVNGSMITEGGATFNNTLKIGNATLSWDATNNALKIDKTVYSTGGMSALGFSDIEGGGSDGATSLSGLLDVTLTSPTDGQILKYNGTKWVNDSLVIPTLSWDNITGKPNWISSTKPTYSFSELLGKPNSMAGYGINTMNTGSWTDSLRNNNIGFLSSSSGAPVEGSNAFGLVVKLNEYSGFGGALAMRNDNLYFQTKESDVLQGWNTVWHNKNLTRVSQLSNDAGYITNLGSANSLNDLFFRTRMKNLDIKTIPGSGIVPFNTLAMQQGEPLLIDPEFESGVRGISTYNNLSNNNVLIDRIDDATASNSTGKVLRIRNIGTANPELGGFVSSYTARANAIIYQVFRAKIPVGYKLGRASNSLGNGFWDDWITDTDGTGKWEWYGRITYCGDTGNFATAGHVYLIGTVGTPETPVDWFVSYLQVYDINKATYTGFKTKLSDKLSIPRTIWGQSFDGSNNITGNLTTNSITSNLNANLDIMSNGTGAITLKYNRLDDKSVALTSNAFRPLAAASGNIDLGSTDGAWRNARFTGTVVADKLAIYDDLHIDSATEYRRIQSFGSKPLAINPLGNNVGIGTTTPERGFTVNTQTQLKDLFINTGDASLKVYAPTLTSTNDGTICFQTAMDRQDGETSTYPTSYPVRNNLVFQPRGGQVYIGEVPTAGDVNYKLNVNGNIKSSGYLTGNGFMKLNSDNTKVLLAGGSDKLISDFATSDHTHGLGNYNFAKTFSADETNSTTFRTTVFGDSTHGHKFKIARWSESPTMLGGVGNFGTSINWAGADTHGFLAVDYNLKNAVIGGGSGDKLNWTGRVVLFGQNIGIGSTEYAAGNQPITAISTTSTAATFTRGVGNLTLNYPTFNQDTTGNAATVTDGMYLSKRQYSSATKSFYSMDETGLYSTLGLEIREATAKGAAVTDNKCAPAIGFHWGGFTQAIIAMRRDAEFHFCQSYTDSNTYVGLNAKGLSSPGNLLLNGGSAIHITSNGQNNNSITLGPNYFKPFDDANANIDLGTSTAKWRDIWAARSINANSGNFTTSVTASGFIKQGSSSSYLLTGDGGHKALSDFDYEANLKWGGKNFSGTFGCIDAAMVPTLGANRLAFMPSEAITVEYSRDSGNTWIDYGANDTQKAFLFAGPGNASLGIGKCDSTNKDDGTYRLRVTINTGIGKVYTALNKFCILISTNGSTGTTCTIDAALEATPTVFKMFSENTPISGWSGYNIINIPSLVTFGNTAASQYGRVRFTFASTGGSDKYVGMTLYNIFGYGGVGWTTPSNMAKLGTIYSYDSAQGVSFPGTVSVASNLYERGNRVYSAGNTNIGTGATNYAPGNHTHSFSSLTGHVTASNEFNFLPAGFNNVLHVNYKAIDQSACNVSEYVFDNGNGGRALIQSSGFKKEGSSNSYVLLGGGGHKEVNDFYHKDNANKRDVNWNANILTASAGSFIRNSAEPLTLTRTDTGPNIVISFNTQSFTKCLGFANGELKVGDNADISGTGSKIWHAGNSNLSNIDWNARNLRLNGDGGTGNVQLELWRGTNASWKILNTGGDLKLMCNYTSTVGNYFDVLNLSYNTGDATFKNNVITTGYLKADSLWLRDTRIATSTSDAVYIGDLDYTNRGLFFKTGGVESARITANGLFGIGTTAPVEKLDVSGNIKSTGGHFIAGMPSSTGDWARGLVLHDLEKELKSGLVFFGTGSNLNRISLGCGSTPWSGSGLHVDSANNVGIGTTTPTEKFEVTGNIKINGKGLFNNITAPNGLSLYGGYFTGSPNYGIIFGQTSTYGKHGSVQGDYSTYFTMTGTTNRGWIFKHDTTAIGSLSSSGELTVNKSVKSTNYAPNAAGFSFDSDGSAEVGNLKVRGNLDVTVFSAQEVKGTNGMLYVSDSSEIVSYSKTTSITARIEVKDPVFAVNDIIITKSFNGSNIRSGRFKVTSVANTVLTVNILETPTGEIKAGNPIVRIANTSDESRTTSILLNPYDGGKIDFIEDIGDGNPRILTRIGKLDGLYNLTGNGLYSTNVNLEGRIDASSGKIGQFDINGNFLWLNDKVEGTDIRVGSSVMTHAPGIKSEIFINDTTPAGHKSIISINSTPADPSVNLGDDPRSHNNAIEIGQGSVKVGPNNLMDVPGLLLAGNVTETLEITYAYGKRGRKNFNSTTTFSMSKGADNLYRVTHNLGHTNYTISVTPWRPWYEWNKVHAIVLDLQADYFQVVFVDSGTSNTWNASGMCFQVFGENRD